MTRAHLEAQVLRWIRGFDRDSPAGPEELGDLAHRLAHRGVKVRHIGACLGRLKRAHRGVVSAGHGLYAWDVSSIKEAGVGGNSTPRRDVPLSFAMPVAEIRRAVLAKAVREHLRAEKEAGAGGRYTVGRFCAAVENEPIAIDAMRRAHAINVAKERDKLVSDLIRSGDATWCSANGRSTIGLLLSPRGVQRWYALWLGAVTWERATEAGLGRLRMGATAKNLAFVVLCWLGTDRDLHEAGLGSLRGIESRRKELRDNGWKMPDSSTRGLVAADEDPERAAIAACVHCGVSLVMGKEKIEFFLPVMTRASTSSEASASQSGA